MKLHNNIRRGNKLAINGSFIKIHCELPLIFGCRINLVVLRFLCRNDSIRWLRICAGNLINRCFSCYSDLLKFDLADNVGSIISKILTKAKDINEIPNGGRRGTYWRVER